MKNLLNTLFLLMCSAGLTAYAQPLRYYAPPMAYPISLSANFGELRPAHLHSGIDLRTGGKEGEPVFAVADGYVSRIAIRTLGYGNALYVQHPNGTTSVYGHLRNFIKPIAEYLRKAQYAKQSFVIDIDLDSSVFPLKRGSLIGFSGNSGNSFGPHLHFEIRDEQQRPFNVMMRNIYDTQLPDSIPPQATMLLAYGFDTVQNVPIPVCRNAYSLMQRNTALRLAVGDTIALNGAAFFGLDLLDRMSGNVENTYGVSRLEMRVNDSLTFAYVMDIFSFDETRYCNAMIDFDERMQSGRTVVKLYVAPNNLLSIYSSKHCHGVVAVPDSGVAKINIDFFDDAKNHSTLQFYVRSAEKPMPASAAKKMDSVVVDCNRDFNFAESGFGIDIPAGAMYDNSYWKMKKQPAMPGLASPVFAVLQPTTPPHRSVVVRIAADVPTSQQAKAVVVCIDNRNRKTAFATRYTDGYFTAFCRTWGRFGVEVDTIAPRITPVNFGRTARLQQATITLRVKDNLSDLKEYAGYVDGKWALFEYDEKYDLFHYTFVGARRNRQHTIVFTASDIVGNEARREFRVVW